MLIKVSGILKIFQILVQDMSKSQKSPKVHTHSRAEIEKLIL